MKDTQIIDWLAHKLGSQIKDEWSTEDQQVFYVALKRNIDGVTRWVHSLIEDLLVLLVIERSEPVIISNIPFICKQVSISLQNKFEKEIEQIPSAETAT